MAAALGVGEEKVELVRCVWKALLRTEIMRIRHGQEARGDPHWLTAANGFPKTAARIATAPPGVAFPSAVRRWLINEILDGMGFVTVFKERYDRSTGEYEVTAEAVVDILALDDSRRQTLVIHHTSPCTLSIGASLSEYHRHDRTN